MSNRPVYWKTRLDEVESTLAMVKKGTVTQPYVSAGGRPIYMLEYGKSTLPPRTANCSSALGAQGKIECYADKRSEDYVPTVFLCGCVHGGEFEGTAAMLNLIKLIETGTDYAGNRNDAIVALAEKLHLILVPMVNPDGRSHIPFDTFVGRTFADLRYYNQGTWKDGSLCGWPECKMIHPIKDYVDYLGGYFNDDGVNMMHEDFIGGKLSTGTQLVFDICREHAPDFSILLHGGDNSTPHILPPDYSSMKTKKEILAVTEAVAARSEKEGIGFTNVGIRRSEDREIPPSFNLISAMHHCCSEPAITYESNQGLTEHREPCYTHEQIYLSHMILFEETFRVQLERYGKI
ncbi:MAG: hypothetical protein IJD51_01280 [Clostridia bacterium]|nr:hypothetical protein [Clostridia bacterium]